MLWIDDLARIMGIQTPSIFLTYVWVADDLGFFTEFRGPGELDKLRESRRIHVHHS